MAYKVRNKKGSVPVWVWCIGALTAYFLLVEKKIVQINQIASRGGSYDEYDREYIIEGQPSFMHQLKSKI